MGEGGMIKDCGCRITDCGMLNKMSGFNPGYYSSCLKVLVRQGRLWFSVL